MNNLGENKQNIVVKDTKKGSCESSSLIQICDGFNEIVSTLSTFRSQITLLQNQIKGLEKTTKKQIKTMEKELSKRKIRGKREPGGFARPTKISEGLCEFLEKPVGSEVARTEVTQYIVKYIKNNDLQNPKNRKEICADEKLKKLLDLKGDEELNYFNLQTHMNKHFI